MLQILHKLRIEVIHKLCCKRGEAMENNNINTKIRFWGGLKTIGGTIVSVEYENSRIIVDFGLFYSPSESFSAIVKTRQHALVEDYINLNKIPPIDGIYSRKCLRHLASIIPAEEDERNTAVIISHTHLDHIGAMGMISPKVPVYLTEESLKLYEAIEEVGDGVFGDRGYSGCPYNEAVNLGEIKVTAIPVDHDVIGACGFLIETPDTKIVYSGDLRLHGKYPELTKNFLSKARSFQANLLIMEGTMINGEKESKETKASCQLDGVTTEVQVTEIFIELLKKYSGIVLMNISETNLERAADIVKAAAAEGRTVVLEPKTAYLLWRMLGNHNFMVYKSEELEIELQNNTAPEWIKNLLKSYEGIAFYDINVSPGKYVLQNSFKNLMELLDLNLKNGVYIHSNAVPLGAYDPDWEKLQIFLRRLGLDYQYAGSSGHAFHSHLKCMIDEIKPEILIPLHSFYPEKLYPESKVQFLPQYDAEYIIKDKKVIKVR